nr:PREDICTED: putative odorant-binding protein A5 [Bemisia tabaci]XP_018904960.1 PREDICTED: putative odorant-binding protein A5 [Bemisia tabaci]XP_018904961.1 PREDICTED: putative odorant-binding protein A5 [Bemisia tabaci]XP_018904962.1 PREDICTED: putative odorant-binding protein A5 [Bemisia tabaci]
MSLHCPNLGLGYVLSTACILVLFLVTNFSLADDGILDEMPKKERIKMLKKWKIIPECIFIKPRHEVLVKHEGDIPIKFGTEVKPAAGMAWLTQNMRWNNTPEDLKVYYSAMLVGLDEPSVQTPNHREYLYWLVTNIPGNRIVESHTIAEYQRPNPNANTGLHRYVYIVYRQPCGKMIYKEKHIDVGDIVPRYNFSNRIFADKYGYAGPYAVNFFTTKSPSPQYT